MTSVTVKQARLAHKLGIKQRKSDGKYGFKLPCPVCGKPVEEHCFCAETIEAAIEAKQSATLKSPYPCSQPCWWNWTAYWDEQWDAICEFFNDVEADTGGTETTWDDLLRRIEAILGPKTVDEEHAWPADARSKVAKADPKLYRELQEQYAADQEFDYEPYEDGDVSECSCELGDD